MLEKIARIISAIFSPLLIPTYAMTLVLTKSILFIVSSGSKLGVIATTFAVTCVIPIIVIGILLKTKVVSDSGLNKREERPIPYGVTAVCYFVLAWYLDSIHSPLWLSMFIVGAGLATVISAIVNRWWKISAHGAAMGGLTALIFCLMYYQLNITGMSLLFCSSIIATGLVGTCRLILERHTLMQVLAGIANGIVCVTACVMLTH